MLQVLRNAWVDRTNTNKNSFNGEFQGFITRYHAFTEAGEVLKELEGDDN